MNRLKPHKAFLITTLVATLALAFAVAPTIEAGKRSKGQSQTQSKPQTDQTAKSGSPWLGVQIQTLDADLAERYDLEIEDGVYIEEVVDNSPADDAGLRTGDIILEFNGAQLESADQLIDLVADGKPGDEITLLINRNGRTVTEVATLGKWKRPDNRRFSTRRMGPKHSYGFFESQTDMFIGVSLETISGQLLAYFGAEDGHGALIKEVVEDTPAEKAGLKAGDVIVKVAGEEIESLADVQDAVRETDEGETIELTVLRGKREKSFIVTVEERESSFFDRPLFDRSFGSHNRPHLQLQNLPRMRGLSRGNIGRGSLYFDLDDYESEMEQLRSQMRELRRELDRLREDVDGK